MKRNLIILINVILIAILAQFNNCGTETGNAIRGESGRLDLFFGKLGFVKTFFGNVEEFAYVNGYTGHIAVQSDGKIVTVGSNGRLIVARYLKDGRPDPDFDGDGLRTIAMCDGVPNVFNDVAIDKNDKIIAVGYLCDQWVVVRFNGDGSLDTSFNGSGILQELGFSVSTANGVAIDSSDRIIVTGSRQNAQGDKDLTVVRYFPDGTKDNSFAAGGIYTFDLGLQRGEGAGIVKILKNGKILMKAGVSYHSAGIDHADLLLLQLTADGSLDNSFNGTGYHLEAWGGLAYYKGLDVNSSGDIYVSGWSYFSEETKYDVFVRKFNSSGQIVTSFGDAGMYVHSAASYDFTGRLVLDSEGNILVSSNATPNPGSADYWISVMKLKPSGKLDATFADSGVASYQFPETFGMGTEGTSIAMQADGKILASTTINRAPNGGLADYGIGIIRLWP